MPRLNHKNRTRSIAAALLCGTAALAALPASQGRAYAQAATGQQTWRFDIPAKSLASALADVGAVSGWRIAYAFDLSGTSAPVSGSMTPEQAVARLLAGTTIRYRVTGPRSIVLQDRVAAAHDGAPAADGSVVLDTIDVTGGGGESTVYTPFETAAAASHIPAERIERFRGSSPADIFRGTPGVMSGEARNGAGSVDVNIRGMQGMGRVAVTVDGAENSLQIYQGYQGISNRTFLDPDLMAGVDITRGADVASRGIAGTVAMRTLGADDIVKPGDTWGLRVKGGFGTNTSSPTAGAVGGYAWPLAPYHEQIAAPSAHGMDRPGDLTPTSGSGSIVAAVKEENYDLFAGYAYRKQGNYHAGKNGPYANPVNLGPQTICTTASCQYWPEYIENTGIANYRPGEEVLNTQLQTQSWLAKATLRLDDDHSLQIGYTGFRSEAGDLLASRLTSARGRQPVQQPLTTGVELDTGTLRYRWQPSDTDLIDLTANGWLSHLRQRYAPRSWGNYRPEQWGLAADFRGGSDSLLWGGDVANTSRFDLADLGSLDLTYGLSYVTEDTSPTRHSMAGEVGNSTFRDAARQEAGGFARAAYKPFDWLTLNAGLRYSHYWSEDRSDYSNDRPDALHERDSGGFSPSVGVTVEPLDGVQLYASYSNALRLPSIVEAGGIFVSPNPDLGPERNSSWEIGANLVRDGLLADNDSGMLKLGYFNWDVKNYISREWGPIGSGSSQYYGLYVHNIDRAKFSGLELSGRYENGGFTAELNANYYLGVEFCPTAGTCTNASLYSDYATNQVPPEYSLDLMVSQKMFDDRFTLGGRVLHVGPRAAGHGQVTAQGQLQFISLVSWEPYTLVDVFAEYRINDTFTAAFRVENLTDQYYVDPLSLARQPGPGRTFHASLTGTFGGDQAIPHFSSPFVRVPGGAGKVDWTGAYAGFHFGTGFARTWGSTTSLDGTRADLAAAESADLRLGSSLLAGVQAGYNWQFGNGFVFGVEGDWSRTDLDGEQDTSTTWLTPDGAVGAGLQAKTHHEIDWTASLRGRIGYAFDNRWLVYGTGGVAFAKERQWRDQYTDSGWQYSTSTDLYLVESTSATRAGFTLGGGAEYAINDRWSIKADYTYSRFGRKDFKFEKARTNTKGDYVTLEQVGTEWTTPDYGELCDMFPFLCLPYEAPVYEEVLNQGSPANGRRASNALDMHTFKIGLNYRF